MIPRLEICSAFLPIWCYLCKVLKSFESMKLPLQSVYSHLTVVMISSWCHLVLPYASIWSVYSWASLYGATLASSLCWSLWAHFHRWTADYVYSLPCYRWQSHLDFIPNLSSVSLIWVLTFILHCKWSLLDLKIHLVWSDPASFQIPSFLTFQLASLWSTCYLLRL